MKNRIVNVAITALLISGSVYGKISSSDFTNLSELAKENAVSLMNLTTRDCEKLEGGVCYGIVINNGGPVEIEFAEDWTNRTEVEEL